MIIYRNYTTTDVMYDLPCDINWNIVKVAPSFVDKIKTKPDKNLTA